MKKILIVDDDTDFTDAITAYLEANDFEVARARNGQEGLMLAKSIHPDLIIMDVVMDERTEGFFTVQEIRHTRELQDVPIFMLTSLYSQSADFTIAPDKSWLGHDEFFSKPVDPAQLLAKIRERLHVSEASS